jgi:RNA recognition motif-containing protein
MNIYVGNLAPDATTEDLTTEFAAFGTVSSANLIKDRYSGESRGFAFVEMESKDQAMAAMAALNGKDLKGKPLTVNEARPKSDDHRSSRGGMGGGGRRFR